MQSNPFRRAAIAAAVPLMLLGGCAGPGYDPPVGSPGVGTLGGAGAGALLGRAVAGSNNNLFAIAGGALLGRLAGNVLVDRPRQDSQAVAGEAAVDREQQRRLDYERQAQVQQAETEREIRERQLFDQWKTERGS